MRWAKANLALFCISAFVMAVQPAFGRPRSLDAPACLQHVNDSDIKRGDPFTGREDGLVDNGSSPQETRTFGRLLKADKERKNIKINNLPMAVDVMPFYLKSNSNHEKSNMFGYRYDIIFPRKQDIQKKYEPQQSGKTFSPATNTFPSIPDGLKDEYNSKSSNRLETFHYNSLSPSDVNSNQYPKSDGKVSDNDRSEHVYVEENAKGYSRIETTTVDDMTSSSYPDATEISEIRNTYSTGNGYHYARPTGDKQFLLSTDVSQRETSADGDGEQSASASSVREKIEFLGRSTDDVETLPRVSVRFHSSSFAEDGIPLAVDNEANETEPVEYNFAYSLSGDPEFSHEESRQLETVLGAYHVRLPDGRVQLVQYQADQSGYKPKISYYQIPGN